MKKIFLGAKNVKQIFIFIFNSEKIPFDIFSSFFFLISRKSLQNCFFGSFRFEKFKDLTNYSRKKHFI